MGSLIRRHPVPCPTCAARWDEATARFCGRCGATLERPDPTASHRDAAPTAPRPPLGRARLILAAGLGAAILVAAAAAASTGAVDDEARPRDPRVSLPEAGALGVAGRASPEQQEALDRFDPDRRACRPHGCEAWRLTLEDPSGLVAVDEHWLVAVDGSTLRRRPARGSGSLDDGDETTEHDLTWLVRRQGGGEIAGDPVDLAVARDGTALLLWPELLAAIGPDGESWLAIRSPSSFAHDICTSCSTIPTSSGTAWHVEARAGHVVVISDLPADAPDATDRQRLTGLDLTDGVALWQRDDLVAREFLPAGLAATARDGSLQLIDTSSGRTRWRRPVGPDARVQVSPGPWVVAGVVGEPGAVLLDVHTGREVATRPDTRLLTPIQPLGGLWGAAWVRESDRAGREPQVAFVALDDAGQERWRVRLGSPVRGVCCPAAVPWHDDTVAILDPGTAPDAWIIVDAATGQRRDGPEVDPPELPGDPDLGRVDVPPHAPGRLIRRSSQEVAVVTRDGAASLSALGDLEVVSVDPLVVRQGSQLLAIEPVPRARPRD